MRKIPQVNTVISLGDFFDRVTILLVKTHYISSKEGRFSVLLELALLFRSIAPDDLNNDMELTISSAVMELMDIHLELWDVENKIRNKDMPDVERVALIDRVHKLNQERFEMKTSINSQAGSAIFEVKDYDSNRKSKTGS